MCSLSAAGQEATKRKDCRTRRVPKPLLPSSQRAYKMSTGQKKKHPVSTGAFKQRTYYRLMARGLCLASNVSMAQARLRPAQISRPQLPPRHPSPKQKEGNLVACKEAGVMASRERSSPWHCFLESAHPDVNFLVQIGHYKIIVKTSDKGFKLIFNYCVKLPCSNPKMLPRCRCSCLAGSIDVFKKSLTNVFLVSITSRYWPGLPTGRSRLLGWARR
ncbi:hypothetical protein CEXT_204551 [Caerostris extrusa]|uniref:Uncharacterized protein n=1 Tax=Caerostris extrusa TaxID=172846 RepID=A0AAV4MT39_CAEEX|nr:hypothetical protein CEXT_204551 [Caerostris extrusa]